MGGRRAGPARPRPAPPERAVGGHRQRIGARSRSRARRGWRLDRRQGWKACRRSRRAPAVSRRSRRTTLRTARLRPGLDARARRRRRRQHAHGSDRPRPAAPRLGRGSAHRILLARPPAGPRLPRSIPPPILRRQDHNRAYRPHGHARSQALARRLRHHSSRTIEARYHDREGHAHLSWGTCVLKEEEDGVLRFDSAPSAPVSSRVQFAIDAHVKLISHKAPIAAVWSEQLEHALATRHP